MGELQERSDRRIVWFEIDAQYVAGHSCERERAVDLGWAAYQDQTALTVTEGAHVEFSGGGFRDHLVNEVPWSGFMATRWWATSLCAWLVQVPNGLPQALLEVNAGPKRPIGQRFDVTGRIRRGPRSHP